ncbi:MAG: tetratricopeptide repeat protein [Bacillota bacterium]|nr:tetratricopeptide repeat protein [Bacillota bacterium]
MEVTRKPMIRLLLVVIGIIMLCFLPTREFLKITFIIGIPFVFMLGWMRKQLRYSISWFLLGIVLLSLLGFYTYSIYHLPEKIAVREIIYQAESYIADGQYDQAIQAYEELVILGHEEKALKKISWVKREKTADLELEKVRVLISANKYDEAVTVIQNIPSNTRAAIEAQRLLKDLKEGK